MTIFKPCDIRGLVGLYLDPAVACRIGRSLGGLLRQQGQADICVGGDFRRSTPALKQALIEGLTEVGMAVRDLGQVPTPVVYFAGRHFGCPNVAVVTASHNPGQYNGVKFLLAGQPAVPELVRQVEAGLDVQPGGIARGPIQVTDVLPAYEAWLLPTAQALVNARQVAAGGCTQAGAQERIRSGSRETSDVRRASDPNSHEFGYTPQACTSVRRIVLDTMEGATTGLAPRVLRAAGYEVVEAGGACDPDYSQRPPDPSEDRLLQPLAARVLATEADLGLALDGDGDRVVFVDSRGQIVRPEQIAVVLATRCYQRPTVVYDLKCASVLPRTVEAAGGTAVACLSGHGFIKQAMLQRQADLGVEVSGHHFWGVLDGGDDGLFTGLVVCRLLEALGQSLDQLLAPLVWPAITPDLRLPFVGDTSAVLQAIADGCGGRVSYLDGVRAEYEGGWALARGSITESALTLRFEGRDPTHLRELAERFLSAVPDLRDRVLAMIPITA